MIKAISRILSNLIITKLILMNKEYQGENIIFKLNTKMNRKVIKYFLILCPSLTSSTPILFFEDAFNMDNSLISCLGYFVYLYRTVMKSSDSFLLFIHSFTRGRDNYKSQPYIYFDDFVFYNFTSSKCHKSGKYRSENVRENRRCS